jgi:eukaryotic-like serine/threonine-protein kinase
MDAVARDRRLAGRYVLKEEIASGGMAVVWRAEDEVLARPVAVKILRDDLALDPGFLERFRREAVAAARLTHPNIVSVYDTGVDETVCFTVMEDLGGATLRDLLAREGPLPPDAAVEFILPVIRALGFAHSQGLIHRDVKPANILLALDGRVKVTDFGIARAAFAAGDITTTGQVLGTVSYLSPEQVQASDLDGRSDLYSAGVVLYEMLTGRVPFVAETHIATAMMRLTTEPMPPRAVRPGIPRGLETAVLQALARHPDSRYPDAESMERAIARHAGRDRTSVMAPPVQTPSVEPRRERSSAFRSWMLVPLLLVAVAALLIGAGLLLGQLGLGGPFDTEDATTSPGAREDAEPTEPIQIRGARDFDPEGDGSENPEEAPAAVDGDPGTTWETEGYNSAALGGLKAGVGLWVDLGGEMVVTRLRIASELPGWTFEVREGPYASPSEPVAGVGGRVSFTMPSSGNAEVDLDSLPTEGLLIWFTELAPDDGRFRASIAEVTVVGRQP